MRPILARLNLLDLELEPITFFEMMDMPIECEQELERMVGLAANIM